MNAEIKNTIIKEIEKKNVCHIHAVYRRNNHTLKMNKQIHKKNSSQSADHAALKKE